MGKASELMRSYASLQDSRVVGVRTRLPATKTTTPRKIMEHVANENPLLRDQMLRKDGAPRSSTRILFDGRPPRDLDEELEIRVIESPTFARSRRVVVVVDIDLIIIDIVIVVVLPCDG